MADSSLPAQIDYTSRDYESLRVDMISRVQARIPEWAGTDPADFGVALVESFAYMGDLMSYYIDRAANESSLSTARKRTNVVALARDFGYNPAGYTPATVSLTFVNTSVYPLSIPAGTVVSARVSVNDLFLTIPFETSEELTVASNATASVTAVQGVTRSGDLGYGEPLGISTGAASQVFEVPDSNVLRESVQIYMYDGVNYLPWKQVDHLYDHSPLSRVYRVRDTGQEITYVEFGDGVSGLVPSVGHYAYAEYRVVDGVLGNVPAASIKEITSIPGVDSSGIAVLIGSLSVTNDTPAVGGTDPEDTESIRFNARQAYRTANRAVTLEDYQNIALSLPACGKASAQSEFSPSVLVAVAPYRNTGSAEERPGFDYVTASSTWVESPEMTALISNVTALVSAASLAGTSVTVSSPVYSPLQITISVEAIDSLRQVDALRIVKQSIFEQFDYSKVPFGSTVIASDIVALVSSLGVSRGVSVGTLKRVSDASSTGTLVANPDEIFTILDDGLTINVTGGLDS